MWLIALLGINPSLITYEDFQEKLMGLPKIEKILVYGTKDECFFCVENVKAAAIPRLQVFTVQGADHGFKGMHKEYINQCNLLFL